MLSVNDVRISLIYKFLKRGLGITLLWTWMKKIITGEFSLEIIML